MMHCDALVLLNEVLVRACSPAHCPPFPMTYVDRPHRLLDQSDCKQGASMQPDDDLFFFSAARSLTLHTNPQ